MNDKNNSKNFNDVEGGSIGKNSKEEQQHNSSSLEQNVHSLPTIAEITGKRNTEKVESSSDDGLSSFVLKLLGYLALLTLGILGLSLVLVFVLRDPAAQEPNYKDSSIVYNSNNPDVYGSRNIINNNIDSNNNNNIIDENIIRNDDDDDNDDDINNNNINTISNNEINIINNNNITNDDDDNNINNNKISAISNEDISTIDNNISDDDDDDDNNNITNDDNYDDDNNNINTISNDDINIINNNIINNNLDENDNNNTNDDDSINNNKNNNPPKLFKQSEEEMRLEREADIIDYLYSNTGINGEDLQYKAIQWLAHKDKSQYSIIPTEESSFVTKYDFITRYALVAFYFSTIGGLCQTDWISYPITMYVIG